MGKTAVVSGDSVTKRAGALRQRIKVADRDHADRSVEGRMQPLPERARQAPMIVAQEAEYRGATNHRVLTPLDIYRERGQISTRQFNAGAALYKDWAFGLQGVTEQTGSGGETGTYMSEARMMAMQSFERGLKGVTDRRQRELVLDVCCHENMVAVIARVRAEDAEDVMKRLRAALALVGDAYGMPSEATTDVIKPRVTLPIAYLQAPDGSFELTSINGISVTIRVENEADIFKAALEWANEWIKRKLCVVSARNVRA